MIECQECGELYEPLTDAYKCPVCGSENYPDEEEDRAAVKAAMEQNA